MGTVQLDDITVSLPLPLYLLVEDVGWWRGEDGSSRGEPYRNGFCRDHCLADYEALSLLAQQLPMRIGLGMVICEWDRSGLLAHIPGAAWPGKTAAAGLRWQRRLAEATSFLNAHADLLEVGVHGLCHEFWENGRLQRSEFHDHEGNMRPRELIRRHLDAFYAILGENGIGAVPRFFVPPALNHSFGNGAASMQAILREHGIGYVMTRFCRAHRFAPPIHPALSWEEGVFLLERGESPVSWEVAAALPGPVDGPVVALHWANLLHPDPERNSEVIESWADAICAAGERPDRILARDVADCFRQAAAHYLGRLALRPHRVEIDLRKMPQSSWLTGPVRLKVTARGGRRWSCSGGRIVTVTQPCHGTQVLEILPDPHQRLVRLVYENEE